MNLNETFLSVQKTAFSQMLKAAYHGEEYTQTKKYNPRCTLVIKTNSVQNQRRSSQYLHLFSEHYSMNKSTCEIAESLEELTINKRFMPFSVHYGNVVEREVCIIQI